MFMNIKELKDGMVLTFKDGRQAIIFKERVYEIKESKNRCFFDNLGCIEQWNNENLTLWGTHPSKSDIMKVEYMGETIWELVEYVSFMDAVNSGKRFKYKGWNFYFEELRGVLYYIESTYTDEEIKKILNEKAWIIE